MDAVKIGSKLGDLLSSHSCVGRTVEGNDTETNVMQWLGCMYFQPPQHLGIGLIKAYLRKVIGWAGGCEPGQNRLPE